jgi:hypothetical protein
MPNVTRFTRSITATDDSGKQHRLNLFTKYRVDTDSEGTKELPVRGIIQSEDKESVNRLDKGEYEIVLSGIRLHSADPDAP